MNAHLVSGSAGERLLRFLLVLAGVVFLVGGAPAAPAQAASQFDLAGPAGSGRFGAPLLVLPNGNLAVADPAYSSVSIARIGAVYLYNGATHALISTLTGSQTDDLAGVSLVPLNNGHFLVWAPGWSSNTGAVAWCSAATGCNGTISASNSAVGNLASGANVYALANGDYVISNPGWANGPAANAGAVRLCNGATGCIGPFSTGNSLVGSQPGDMVGFGGIVDLGGGAYLVLSSNWANGGMAVAGAATWCAPVSGCAGPVSASNSLVGGAAQDHVGSSAGGMIFLALGNGNYVFSSAYQAPTGGAVTVGYGSAPIPNGPVGSANSVTSSASLLTIFTYDTANAQVVVGRPNENMVSFYQPSFTSLFIPVVRK